MAKNRKGVLPHKVQIKQKSFGRADALIDGRKIKGVMAIDYHIEANEIPRIDLSLYGAPDFDADSFVGFDFTSKTVDEAVNVLRCALRSDKELYNAFLASVLSAIQNAMKEPDGVTDEELAVRIADGIIGKE